MDPFQHAFSQLAQQLHAACELQLIWKDADPKRWHTWPPSLSQHRNTYCLAVKQSEERRAQCCAADNAPPSGDGIIRRRCPFGIIEWVIPGRRNGLLLGWAFAGAWGGAPPARTDITTPLPMRLPAPKAKAQATVAARLLQGILHLHPGSTPSDDPRLAQARDFMRTHLHIGLRAASVAEHLHLSPSRFVHWFAESAGQPYSAELRHLVMARANELLLHSQQSITGIAMDLGFGSPASFTTTFGRHYGMPPAHWRRAMAKAGE